MEIRHAKIEDVDSIHSLISTFAERDRMLFRSKADIYENLQTFYVAWDGKVVGCCALSIIWNDLCEVKSLAVAKECAGKGIGRKLVENLTEDAKNLGLPRIFALTLEPGFFEKLGFERIDRHQLPMKVWRDCARCPKQDHCDEVAMVKDV